MSKKGFKEMKNRSAQDVAGAVLALAGDSFGGDSVGVEGP
jgi:hypothetical protein